MKHFTTALDLFGATSITVGAALAWTPAGFLVGGVLALVFSIALANGEGSE